MAGTNMTVGPVGDYSCNLWPDNPHRCDVVVGLRKGLAAISFVGTLLMLAVIWLYRKYRTFPQRLVLYLTISACINTTSLMMGNLIKDGPLCNFQGFWLQFFVWTSLMWVCAITLNLVMTVTREVRTDKYEWLYHVLCWGWPLLMACLPFMGDHYGPAGQWCWIEDNWKWRMGTWYVPLFIIIVLLFVAYAGIIVVLRRKIWAWQGAGPEVDRHKELLKQDIKPLRLYPFIYLLLSIFPLINRIQDAVHANHAQYWLVILHVISECLTGFLYALVFGLDKDTRVRLTPSQIKMALQNRLRAQPEIEEYDADDHRHGRPGENHPYDQID